MYGSKDYTKAGKFDQALLIASKAATASGAAVGAIPVAPWAQLAGLSGVATGLALKVVYNIRNRERLMLSGDAKAIAGFAKRCAKWTSKKRERVAVRLGKKLTAALGRGKHKVFLGKKNVSETRANQVLVHKLQLKIAALHAVEAHARNNSAAPLVKDDPATIPVKVEQNPLANADLPGDDSDADANESAPLGISTTGWIVIGGGALLLAGALVYRGGKRQSKGA